ncbi:MAG: MFS transporter [Acidimicrobiia bacterium]
MRHTKWQRSAGRRGAPFGDDGRVNGTTGDHDATGASTGVLGLHGWLGRPVIGVAIVMAAAGFAQFSPTAALADVAEHFGELRNGGETIAEQAGLPGTVLGAGLATIRLAAVFALPLAALADRFGRRRSLLTWASLGLVVVIAAAGSPGYWWFVAAFALARPLLTATDTIAEVMAAEHTGLADRAKAIALMSAAYGVGAGSVAVLRGAVGESLGFRWVFGLAVLPLLAVWLAARMVTEPSRYHARPVAVAGRRPVLGSVRRGLRGRLGLLAGLTFASALITGPANTFLFVYAENVLDASTALTGTLVVAAAPAGLLGLVVGRYLSDHAGRRPTAAVGLVALAGAGVLTYSGTVPALAAGYLLGIFVGSAYATPTIALATELFPTSTRASVAGWLVLAGVLGATLGLFVAGAVADATDSFGSALALVCVPAGLTAVLLAFLPETRGLELEESAPEPA